MPDSHFPPPDTQGEASETFQEITITGLTASRLVQTDANQQLDSVLNLASWVAGAAGELSVADDGDGTITVSFASTITTAHTWSAAQTFTAATVHSANATVGTNNAYDLGASGTAWRSIYFATQTLGPDGTVAAPTYSFSGSTNWGLYKFDATALAFSTAGTARALFITTGFSYAGYLAMGATANAPDCFFRRQAANVGSMENGVTAQEFRVYGTTTGPRYVALTNNGTDSNVFGAGGGSMGLGLGSTVYWKVGSSGAPWQPELNNAYDIGSSSFAPRSIYFGTQALGPNGTAGAPTYSFSAGATEGMYRAGAADLRFALVGADWLRLNGSITQQGGSLIRWATGSDLTVVDLILARDAANTLAQRNGTAAQTFRVYNTFTDAGNYERLSIGWASNVCEYIVQNAGTGSARALNFGTGNATQWGISTSGHWLSLTDNTYDIGASGANRPRTGYFGTALVVGTSEAGTYSGHVRIFNTAASAFLTMRQTTNDVEAYHYISTDRYEFGVATNHALHVATNNTVRLIISNDGTTLTFSDALNIAVNATTGTKIGTATNQKIGFWNATPVVQGAAIADASGGATIDAEARTAINTLLARNRTYGLIAT